MCRGASSPPGSLQLQIQPAWLAALALSLSAHLGLIATLGDGARAGSRNISLRQMQIQTQPRPINLRMLNTAPSAAMPTTPAPEASALPPHQTAAAPSVPPEPTEPPALESIAEPPLLTLAEVHYFWPGELGQKPQLFDETASTQVLTVPDVFPLPVIVHLLISEQGSVDKVLLEESFLSEQAKRFVIDSFANTRFSPGTIDAKPVKSRLMIEVRLEGALPVLQ